MRSTTAATLVLLLSVTGCSSGGTPNGGGSGGDGGGHGGSSGSSSGSGSGGGSSSSGGGDDGGIKPQDAGSVPDSSVADLACDSMSTDDLCVACCTNNHPSGSMTYDNALYDCVCGPPVGTQGICQSQCASTDCSAAADAGSSEAGDPCDVCTSQSVASDGGACASSVNSMCGQDPDCLAFSNCVDNCQF
jgi:hypothetical protein